MRGDLHDSEQPTKQYRYLYTHLAYTTTVSNSAHFNPAPNLGSNDFQQYEQPHFNTRASDTGMFFPGGG